MSPHEPWWLWCQCPKNANDAMVPCKWMFNSAHECCWHHGDIPMSALWALMCTHENLWELFSKATSLYMSLVCVYMYVCPQFLALKWGTESYTKFLQQDSMPQFQLIDQLNILFKYWSSNIHLIPAHKGNWITEIWGFNERILSLDHWPLKRMNMLQKSNILMIK